LACFSKISQTFYCLSLLAHFCAVLSLISPANRPDLMALNSLVPLKYTNKSFCSFEYLL
ncbi:hypothetical protein BCV72DRAFT_205164, partial [Rhizopus microsporus var. microsporus]